MKVIAGIAMTLAFLLSVPALGRAQSSIAGTVRDTSGAVLPGVTVEAASPALIEKVRTAVTDGEGRYQIVDLRPGTYTVTFTLPGFSTFKRDGIVLPAAFTATVNAELSVGALEETVTVSGEAPVVDVKSVASTNVLSNEVLAAVPTATRSPQGYTVFLPGVEGGSASGIANTPTNASLSVHGSRGSEHNVAIDGFPDRNMGASGGAGFYYNINPATIQEQVVLTSGVGADQQAAGILTNVIPRDGGNRLSGLVFVSYTDENFVGDNRTADMRARGVGAGGTLRKTWDVNPGVGGPLLQDKVWFFGSYRNTSTAVDGASRYNLTPTGWVYTPDLSRPTVSDKNKDRSHYLRLTWQATPRNKFSALYDYAPRFWHNRNISATTSPEATNWNPYDPQYIVHVTWKSPLTSRFLLEAGTSYQATNFNRYYNDRNEELDRIPRDRFAVSAVEQTTNRRFRAPAQFGSNLGNSRSLRTRFGASYVTGTHTFTVGGNLYQGSREARQHHNQDYEVRLRNGVPNRVTLFAPFRTIDELKADFGLYAQDQWAVRRLTLTMGVRYDYFNASSPAQAVEGNRWVPAATYDAVQGPGWHDVTPRFGVSYDLFGDGKTALKAALSRYVEGAGLGIPSWWNPVVRSVETATRTWTDRNLDFLPDCDFASPAANGECGPLSDLNFGKANPNAVQFDGDVVRGFGKRGYNWETSAALQHELVQGLSVNVGYYRRWYGNAQAQDNLLVTPADFDPFCLTLPGDPRLPGGGTQLCGFYDISREKFGQNQGFVTLTSAFGKQTEIYNGFDLTVNGRLANGAQFTGGVSTGRTALNTCYVIDSPATSVRPIQFTLTRPTGSSTALQNLNFCESKPPFRAQVKLLGSYPLPWGFRASGAFSSVPGADLSSTTYVASNAEIRPTLGRDVSTGANGTLTLPIIKPGTLFVERRNKLDVRFSRIFAIGGTRIAGSLDIFNVLNANDAESVNTRYGPDWLQPTTILGARSFQLSGQIDF